MLHIEFQATEPSGPEEKDFSIFFVHVYGLNLGPPGRDHLGPWDFRLNIFGKGLPGNATF